MSDLFSKVNELLASGLQAAGVDVPANVQWSERAEIADLTSVAALRAAKQMKMKPLELAEKIIAGIPPSDYVFSAVAPGYINIMVPVEDVIRAMANPSLTTFGKTYILDYGGPNIAKPMHVGHLRSLLIGESLKRILRARNNYVISDIHWGDWGLQMGLLITAIEIDGIDLDALTFADLETLYPACSARAKADETFRKAAQKAVMCLQTKQPAATAIWERLVELTKSAILPEINRLDVSFDALHGESSVGGMVEPMIDELLDQGIAVESDGAIIVKVTGDTPLILRNSEGAALYAATDLATIKDRKVRDPDEIVYVVDQRQALHFKQLFEVAQVAQTVPDKVKLTHVGFGTVNGPDGKPLKTRDGGTPKLGDLLNAAYEKALERNPDPITAELIAMAAIKFADLSTHRSTNYVFDLDRFLSFEGKTGPYLCYQSVRMAAILRKADPMPDGFRFFDVKLTTVEEKAIALVLYRFREIIAAAGDKMAPNMIADHAYNLAQMFSSYYAHTTVLGDPSRVYLTMVVKHQLDYALRLLTIQVPEAM
jgi:arginyl-tRNA synthetase